LAYYLSKEVTRAIGEFSLIADGDRVAVAVSGGKDSRALLHFLRRYRSKVRTSFEMVAVHVAGAQVGLPDLRPELEPWFQELDVEYCFVPLDIPPQEPLPLDCFRCSWNRRKSLFNAAVELGCGKLALGHNADDAVATALLNLLFNGRLETMVPRVKFFDGAVTVVRPLIYLTEKALISYARAAGFPVLPRCSQASISRRAQIKDLMRQFGREQEQIRANIWRASRRAMGF
jgi:tRNA 2-thiocytidine biosynthesis protein TtcA